MRTSVQRVETLRTNRSLTNRIKQFVWVLVSTD